MEAINKQSVGNKRVGEFIFRLTFYDLSAGIASTLWRWFSHAQSRPLILNTSQNIPNEPRRKKLVLTKSYSRPSCWAAFPPLKP